MEEAMLVLLQRWSLATLLVAGIILVYGLSLYVQEMLPPREGPAPGQRIDNVRLTTSDGRHMTCRVRVKPYVTTQTRVGMVIATGTDLANTNLKDLLCEVVTELDQATWLGDTGVLLWSTKGDTMYEYESWGYGWAEGKWFHGTLGGFPWVERAGGLPCEFNVTTWAGGEYQTRGNVQVRKVWGIGVLQRLWPYLLFYAMPILGFLVAVVCLWEVASFFAQRKRPIGP